MKKTRIPILSAYYHMFPMTYVDEIRHPIRKKVNHDVCKRCTALSDGKSFFSSSQSELYVFSKTEDLRNYNARKVRDTPFFYMLVKFHVVWLSRSYGNPLSIVTNSCNLTPKETRRFNIVLLSSRSRVGLGPPTR